MTEKQQRGIVLRKFYEKREDGLFQWAELAETEQLEPGIDYIRMSDQLGDYGLIDWQPVRGSGGKTVGGIGQINAFGIDVIEGEAQSPLPIEIKIDQRSYNISASSHVQIGDNNVQDVQIHIEKLFDAIERSSGSPDEKAEAKGRLKKFLEHPLVTSIAGGLAGTAKFSGS